MSVMHSALQAALARRSALKDRREAKSVQNKGMIESMGDKVTDFLIKRLTPDDGLEKLREQHRLNMIAQEAARQWEGKKFEADMENRQIVARQGHGYRVGEGEWHDTPEARMERLRLQLANAELMKRLGLSGQLDVEKERGSASRYVAGTRAGAQVRAAGIRANAPPRSGGVGSAREPDPFKHYQGVISEAQKYDTMAKDAGKNIGSYALSESGRAAAEQSAQRYQDLANEARERAKKLWVDNQGFPSRASAGAQPVIRPAPAQGAPGGFNQGLLGD